MTKHEAIFWFFSHSTNHLAGGVAFAVHNTLPYVRESGKNVTASFHVVWQVRVLLYPALASVAVVLERTWIYSR